MKATRPPVAVILTIGGEKVNLDASLAGLYGVNTKRLNEPVKRNIEHLPEDFRFSSRKIQGVANCDHLAC